MNKYFFTGIVLCFGFLSLSCGAPDNTQEAALSAVEGSSQQEFASLKIVLPGKMSARMEEFLIDDFAQRMKDDLNLGFEVSYLPWQEYFDEVPVMIAAGQQIDWTWHNPRTLMGYYNDGLLQPLDELLENHGGHIKENIPPENIEAARGKDGKITYIPMAYTPTKGKFNSIMVRQDILDKLNIPEIRSIADIERAATAMNEAFPAMNVLGHSNIIYPLYRGFYPTPLAFINSEVTVAINLETNEVINVTADPAFKELSQTMRRWYEKGWIPEEVITNTMDHKARIISGNYLFIGGGISDPMDLTPAFRENVPDGILREYTLHPEKGMYRFMSATDCSGIPVTAKYPERAMEWLNWISESNDHLNFMSYGIEGQDFLIKEDKLHRLNMEDLFYPWMFFNHKTMNYPDYMSDDFISEIKTWDDDALIPDVFGFIFDFTNVQTQNEELKKVFHDIIRPLSIGYLKYDDVYDDLQIALEDAGIQEFMAEIQRQVDLYIGK